MTPRSGACVPISSFLGTASLGAGNPYEKTKTLALPSKVKKGTYYVWLQVDPSNSIVEVDETNNDAVWNQRVRVGTVFP